VGHEQAELDEQKIRRNFLIHFSQVYNLYFLLKNPLGLDFIVGYMENVQNYYYIP